jgi:hypothetical protein
MAAVFNEDTPPVREKVTTAPSRICGSLYSSWLHFCEAKHLKAKGEGYAAPKLNERCGFSRADPVPHPLLIPCLPIARPIDREVVGETL